MLRVGIPKEIKTLEKRVGLVPRAVQSLCEKGIPVLVEQNAGSQSGYRDEEYQKAGALLVANASALYAQADLIQKVKEPLSSEFALLRKDQILFGFLHLASPENAPLVKALMTSGVTAIGYETVETNGRLPLLAPMSEIAGALSAAYAGILRQPSEIIFSELEKAASKYPTFQDLPAPGKVVIFGGGVAGLKALEVALHLKGEVAIIEKSPERRAYLKQFTPHVFAPEENYLEFLKNADVLIGSVHIRGLRAFHVLDEKMLETISRVKKKVIIDIAIDQGGNFPESHSVPYTQPVYVDSWGNRRFCVPNMPSLCGRGASEALSSVTLPYTQALALDPQRAFKEFPELARGVNIESGALKIPGIR